VGGGVTVLLPDAVGGGVTVSDLDFVRDHERVGVGGIVIVRERVDDEVRVEVSVGGGVWLRVTVTLWSVGVGVPDRPERESVPVKVPVRGGVSVRVCDRDRVGGALRLNVGERTPPVRVLVRCSVVVRSA
jgi:hypothetical protein